MVETALLTLWSINHFCSGLFFGALFNFRKLKKISFLKSSLITLLLLVLWEIFERYCIAPLTGFGEELWRNSISDVVIGMIGFFVAYYILKKYPLKILK